MQKTSHKIEIHIYSQILKNWVNFLGQNILEFQNICNIAKESEKIVNEKIIPILRNLTVDMDF